MTDEAIREQVEMIRSVSKRIIQSKETALQFLLDGGIITEADAAAARLKWEKPNNDTSSALPGSGVS